MDSKARDQQIRELLKSDCLTFIEIGKATELSRTRITQLAKSMGAKTGRERRMACTRQRQREELLSRDSLLTRFIAACSKRRLPCKLVPMPSEPHRFLSEELVVNGSHVWLHHASYNSNRHARYIALKAALSTPRGFDAYELPDRKWLIVPFQRRIPKGTLFALKLKPTRSKGGKNYRHDYRDLIEAWYLLIRLERDSAAQPLATPPIV